MKRMAVFLCCATAIGAAVADASPVQAQAFVDQVNRGQGAGVYVPQVPPSARPVIVRPPTRKAAPTRAATLSNKRSASSAMPALPSVGAGSRAIIVYTAGSRFPDVGNGTVKR